MKKVLSICLVFLLSAGLFSSSYALPVSDDITNAKVIVVTNDYVSPIVNDIATVAIVNPKSSVDIEYVWEAPFDLSNYNFVNSVSDIKTINYTAIVSNNNDKEKYEDVELEPSVEYASSSYNVSSINYVKETVSDIKKE